MKRFVLIVALMSCAFAVMAADEHYPFGKPSAGYPIKHKGYTAGYKSRYRAPLWVAYKVTPEYSEGERAVTERPDFYQDPIVVEKSLSSAKPDEFSEAGYWPLPMFSHGDALGRGEEVEKEVYSLVNMLAQKPNRTTRGIWKKGEEHTRKWAKEFGEVWVIAGPVFTPPIKKSKPGFIAIPTAFYKIIVRKDEDAGVKAIGFIIPQGGIDKLGSYRRSIDAIEAETGLDFLSDLDDEQENAAESEKTKTLSISKAAVESLTGGGNGAIGEPAAGMDAPNAGDVWVIIRSGIYYASGHPKAGIAEGGNWMDSVAAEAMGFREIKNK